jgi:signal peptidase I
MMGDNRDRSSDSRVWGFVKREELLGRMQFVYFSWDSVAGRLRWDRVGLPVD